MENDAINFLRQLLSGIMEALKRKPLTLTDRTRKVLTHVGGASGLFYVDTVCVGVGWGKEAFQAEDWHILRQVAGEQGLLLKEIGTNSWRR